MGYLAITSLSLESTLAFCPVSHFSRSSNVLMSFSRYLYRPSIILLCLPDRSIIIPPADKLSRKGQENPGKRDGDRGGTGKSGAEEVIATS
jgi:hypothetical protein